MQNAYKKGCQGKLDHLVATIWSQPFGRGRLAAAARTGSGAPAGICAYSPSMASSPYSSVQT